MCPAFCQSSLKSDALPPSYEPEKALHSLLSGALPLKLCAQARKDFSTKSYLVQLINSPKKGEFKTFDYTAPINGAETFDVSPRVVEGTTTLGYLSATF